MVTFDRATTAARLNIKPAQIDNTLYDAFDQRQVSTIYNPLSQYRVVMELAPKYWQDPEMLKQIWISTSSGTASGFGIDAIHDDSGCVHVHEHGDQ